MHKNRHDLHSVSAVQRRSANRVDFCASPSLKSLGHSHFLKVKKSGNVPSFQKNLGRFAPQIDEKGRLSRSRLFETLTVHRPGPSGPDRHGVHSRVSRRVNRRQNRLPQGVDPVSGGVIPPLTGQNPRGQRFCRRPAVTLPVGETKPLAIDDHARRRRLHAADGDKITLRRRFSPFQTAKISPKSPP